jgi:hypothetical protein
LSLKHIVPNPFRIHILIRFLENANSVVEHLAPALPVFVDFDGDKRDRGTAAAADDAGIPQILLAKGRRLSKKHIKMALQGKNWQSPKASFMSGRMGA